MSIYHFNLNQIFKLKFTKLKNYYIYIFVDYALNYLSIILLKFLNTSLTIVNII